MVLEADVDCVWRVPVDESVEDGADYLVWSGNDGVKVLGPSGVLTVLPPSQASRLSEALKDCSVSSLLREIRRHRREAESAETATANE